MNAEREETLRRIKELVDQQVGGMSGVAEDSNDLGMDEIDFVEFMMAVEEEFDIEVKEEEESGLVLVRNWVDLVSKKQEAKIR